MRGLGPPPKSPIIESMSGLILTFLRASPRAGLYVAPISVYPVMDQSFRYLPLFGER